MIVVLTGLLTTALSAVATPLCGPVEPLAPELSLMPALESVLAEPEAHRVQIVVSEPRTRGAESCLQRFAYRADAEYFYPASAIKLLGAIAALRWLEEHRALSLETPLAIAAASVTVAGEALRVSEPAEPEPLRDTLRAALVVSSNAAYNRLVDLVGFDRLHRTFWAAGWGSVRLRHRLAARGFPRSVQRFSPPILAARGEILAPLREGSLELAPNRGTSMLVGRAHLDAETGQRIDRPLSFAERNAIDLVELHEIMIAVVKPELAPKGFTLSAPHRATLRRLLAEVTERAPRPGGPPDRIRYKPLLTGLRRAVASPGSLHVESKAGRAYGFVLDNAYVRDAVSGKELFVTAVIYANDNQVVGDDDYEYQSVSLPFLEAVGEWVGRARLGS